MLLVCVYPVVKKCCVFCAQFIYSLCKTFAVVFCMFMNTARVLTFGALLRLYTEIIKTNNHNNKYNNTYVINKALLINE